MARFKVDIQKIKSECIIPNEITKRIFNSCDFRGIDLSHTKFYGCAFYDCDFSGANLSYTRFNKCQLLWSDFYNCDIDNMRLYNCEHQGNKGLYVFSKNVEGYNNPQNLIASVHDNKIMCFSAILFNEYSEASRMFQDLNSKLHVVLIGSSKDPSVVFKDELDILKSIPLTN